MKKDKSSFVMNMTFLLSREMKNVYFIRGFAPRELYSLYEINAIFIPTRGWCDILDTSDEYFPWFTVEGMEFNEDMSGTPHLQVSYPENS